MTTEIKQPAEVGKPLPGGGWSESIVELDGAVVMPPVVSSMSQPTGVFDREGRYVPEGALYRKSRPLMTRPEYPEGDLPVLKGRWIWGAALWMHFGHFVVEGTTRFWAIDHIEGEVDGFLYVPKRPRNGETVHGFQQTYLDQMGTGLPIKVAAQPVRVEKLIVPGQGFGLGRISAGTAKYRDAMHRHFGAHVKPDGPERLYISRSALGLNLGGLLAEERLEEYLAAEGYEIFHPQRHPIDVQIARYKAAKQVVSAEGSALHLYAMVGRPDQPVAIVNRRNSAATHYLETHLKSFCRAPLASVTQLRRIWKPEGMDAKRHWLGELDMPAVERELAEAGFVSGKAGWTSLSDEEALALIAERGGSKRKFVVV